MKKFWLLLTLTIPKTQTLSACGAQREKAPQRAILIHTPNSWLLNVYADGSGHLQYGSSGGDGWRFKAGTVDVKQLTKDLKALTSDEKGGLRSHFVFHFESERKGPEMPPPAQYTKDTKVIPALFEKVIPATENFNAERKALLLKTYPPGFSKEK